MNEPRRTPLRPRLSERVLARRHLVGSDERVILYDTVTGTLFVLGSREWAILSCADGTRDLEGILLAASMLGAHAREPALRAFLDELACAGMLAEGLPSVVATADPRAARQDGTPPSRPLDVLPGYAFRCDGRGSCCRMYFSVIFRDEDTLRARAAQPEVLDGARRPERVFLPLHGSRATDLFAVTAVDGACAYLQGDGRCSLHEPPGTKPAGCSLFPATFVDDGETVRVSVSPECACVLASALIPAETEGSGLLPPLARTRGELPVSAHIERVPERLAVAAGMEISRSQLIAWSRALAAAPAPHDALAAYWSLAGVLESEGPDPALAMAALRAPRAPDAHDLLPWIEALRSRAARRAAQNRGWRAPHDLARRTIEWIALTCTRLLAPGALEELLASPAPHPAIEAFHLRAAAHGHRFLGALPLAGALRDAAVRLALARALPSTLTEDTCAGQGADAMLATQYPLAFVETALRGHGLAAYAQDLAQQS